MASPPVDIQVKVTGNAAQDFVTSYYRVLNSDGNKSALPDFYVKPTTAAPLKPDICLNGRVIADTAELQNVFDKEVERCHYDAQSFDCHVINTNYNVGAPDNALGPNESGNKISFALLVSGSVKYWQADNTGEKEVKPFSESFVLVPSREAHGPKAARGARKWLIQGQNFRVVG